ncbi:MAG: phosphate acyltransferase PlsX [SAR202 cluster bacterium Casp-Chloro-G2]|nr:MAG: phosphate acyltransferase PlsX [SAR202 cluster bacterium Casp-Chloro-G2]
MRVALDAMGGDHGPVETVKGAVLAAKSANVEMILVGDQGPVEAELAKYDTNGLAIRLVPSVDKIRDDEHPLQAMRSKPNASVVVATRLVKSGDADVIVSMGSTGGSMASAVLTLGLMQGLERPCLGGPFLGLAPNTVLVDIGSNLDSRPGLLLNFASLGVTWARTYMGIDNPRVALLSVGAESTKGNRQVQESHRVFEGSHLNFVGNVEGMDFFTEKAEVIICDGFVGNILIKFTEGLGAAFAAFAKKRLATSLDDTTIDEFAAELVQLTNRTRTNGGPLFGVNGPVILGHGSSGADEILAAVNTSIRYVHLGMVDIMRQDLARMNQTPNETSGTGAGR